MGRTPRGRWCGAPMVGAGFLVLGLAFAPAVAQEDGRVEWLATDTAAAADSLEFADFAERADPEPLFTSGDGWLALGFLAGTIAMAPLDMTLAQALQDSTLQVHRDLRSLAGALRWLGFPGTAVIGTSMYVAGRVGGAPTLADIALHSTEAVVVSYVFVWTGKNLIGRARPRLEADEPFDFGFARGFRGGSDYRSFPSGHTSSAFAVAAAVTAETRERWPEWTPYVAGVLYTGAAGVGISRMYHNKHWASDVVAGAAIGTFSGLKVVRYHHGNPDNLVDRWLLPAVVPTAAGPMLVWQVPVRWTTGS